MHMLGSLTDEYAELLTRLAVKQEPLEMGQELHVGQPPLPHPTPSFTLQDRNSITELCVKTVTKTTKRGCFKADLLQDNAYRVMQPANHC